MKNGCCNRFPRAKFCKTSKDILRNDLLRAAMSYASLTGFAGGLTPPFPPEELYRFRGTVIDTHNEFGLVNSHRVFAFIDLDGGQTPVVLLLPLGILDPEQIGQNIHAGDIVSGVVHVVPSGLAHLRTQARCYNDLITLIRGNDGPAMPTQHSIMKINTAAPLRCTDTGIVCLQANIFDDTGRLSSAILKWPVPKNERQIVDPAVLGDMAQVRGRYVVVSRDPALADAGRQTLPEFYVCCGPFAAADPRYPAPGGDLAQAIWGPAPQSSLPKPARPGLVRRALQAAWRVTGIKTP